MVDGLYYCKSSKDRHHSARHYYNKGCFQACQYIQIQVITNLFHDGPIKI
jgi:hypothetical protein